MKKVVRKIISMALACMLILELPMFVHAKTTESIVVEKETENTMELIGQEVVHIKYDGTVVYESDNQEEIKIMPQSIANDKITFSGQEYKNPYCRAKLRNDRRNSRSSYSQI